MIPVVPTPLATDLVTLSLRNPMKATFTLLILFLIAALICTLRSESPAGMFRSKADTYQTALQEAMDLANSK